MRGAFVRTLMDLAEEDSRIILLTADLGYMLMEPFMERFPSRFINVGVAEQNMVGLATGLAEAGFVPFVYSIAPFAVLRPYEFIRNGPILHELPARIVGVGGGFEYGNAGVTHHALEDIAVMRAQPGITVIAPADHQQTASALLETWNLPGPIYYRLGKDDKTTVPGLDGNFALGRAQLIRKGSDLLMVSMGSVTSEVANAAEVLASRGIQCSVLVVASLNPAPEDDLARYLSQFPVAMTVETHYLAGGLGSLVSEVVAERQINCRTVRCGVRRMPNDVFGSQDYLHHINGLSSEALVETATRALDQARV